MTDFRFFHKGSYLYLLIFCCIIYEIYMENKKLRSIYLLDTRDKFLAKATFPLQRKLPLLYSLGRYWVINEECKVYSGKVIMTSFKIKSVRIYQFDIGCLDSCSLGVVVLLSKVKDLVICENCKTIVKNVGFR